MGKPSIILQTAMKEVELLQGGRADNMSLQQIAEKHGVPLAQIVRQLQMGMRVEMEHTSDKRIAREIAKDHLAEFPDYYTRLQAMEKEAEEGDG